MTTHIWISFPLLYPFQKKKMATTMIKQQLKFIKTPTNSQQPQLGVHNLYLSPRVLRVPPDYSSTWNENLTATQVPLHSRLGVKLPDHSWSSSSKCLIFFHFSNQLQNICSNSQHFKFRNDPQVLSCPATCDRWWCSCITVRIILILNDHWSMA